MPDTVILELLREELADTLANAGADCGPPNPINRDRYIAASGLQKAVRRGDEDIALRCAARILTEDPPRLWRRLVCIAYEDIGVGDIDVAGRITAAASQKRWRDKHGGDWLIASHLLLQMCRTEKDRTSDELIHIVQYDPALTDHRRCWRSAPIDRLQTFIADPTLSLSERALAIWFALGTNRFNTNVLPERKGFPNLIFETFLEMGLSDAIVEVSRSAQSKMNFPLPAYLPLVWTAHREVERSIEIEEFPDVEFFCDIPSYAIDGFTRPGKQAVRDYLRASIVMRALLEPHAPRKQWTKIVEWLLFHIEGGLCSNRVRWPMGDSLRAQSEEYVLALPASVIPEAKELLRSDIPMLNEIRERVLSQGARAEQSTDDTARPAQ